MISRIWHGKTLDEHSDQYLHFLEGKGTDGYRQVKGNLSIRIWRMRSDNVCHFYTVTEWEKLDNIKSFAGEDYGKAVYYPEDNEYLLEFEEAVAHYESFDVSTTKIDSYKRQLDQLYHGGSWQGECFSEKLKDVDAENAFLSLFDNGHSIAEIVWHCLYWRTVVIKHFEGNQNYREETFDEQNFLSKQELQSRGGWDWLRAAFENSQHTLIEIIQKKTDSFLLEEYKKGVTYSHLIEGIIQHDIYHLGQIGLVKRGVSSTKEN